MEELIQDHAMQKLLQQELLEIRDLQAFHSWLDQKKHFDTDLLRNVAYLSGEVGEVVQAIRTFKKASDQSSVKSAREHLGDELADCLAYLLKLANYSGVNLQDAYVKKMMRNVSRTWHPTEEYDKNANEV